VIANAHLTLEEEYYVCSVCSMKFKQPGNARRHIITVHRNEKPHICLKCDARFGRKVRYFLPEMEFLDSNLTKDSRLLIYAIHRPFYWRILKKTILYSGLKNTYKKIRETRKLDTINESPFVEWKNEGRKLESDKTPVYAQKSRLKMPFKNSISGFF
jgi:hypothetical protein